jgi:hypothetical protein
MGDFSNYGTKLVFLPTKELRKEVLRLQASSRAAERLCK